MARKQYSDEEIQKRIDSLPEAVADLLYSPEMASIVREVADKHKLHIDQAGLLEAEVGELMLGLTEPQDFSTYLAQTLRIDRAKAEGLAGDINKELMSKVRALMGQPSASSVSAAPPAPPQQKTGLPTSVQNPSFGRPSVPPVAVPTPPAAHTPIGIAPKPPQDLTAAEAVLAHKQVSAPAAPASAPPQPAVADTKAEPAASAPAPMKAPETPRPSADVKPQSYKADPYREPIE